MTRPRVTVLLAVHNGGDYLRGVVEDVRAQTYSDLEFLVVDDASTDGSPDIVASSGDPRVRLLQNDRNLGQVPSLNRGLRAARGDYVARIDHDDRMLPTRIERQVAVLDREPAVALVGTWMDIVDEHDRLWARLRGRIDDFVDLVLAILRDRYPFAHPSLMYRRNVILELGGYDPALAPAEDKDLYRRLALARHNAHVVREPLVRHRRHERQLSQERAEIQLLHDWEGQERFLAELAGEEHALRLRLLLSTGVAPGGAETELLERLLDGAQRRLELTSAERERLESLLARHLAGRALAAGPRAYRTLLWSTRREPWTAPAAVVLPAMPALRAAGRMTRRAAASDALLGVRRRARRVRLLRYFYSRLG